jgi:hypothetical protein
MKIVWPHFDLKQEFVYILWQHVAGVSDGKFVWTCATGMPMNQK